ncbi:MAG: RhuM family protein [Micropruina sp.]
MNEPAGEIVIYAADDGAPRLEVRLEDDTVWLSQQQLADLFATTKQNISVHLRNIFDEGELARESTVKGVLTVRREGQRQVTRSIEHDKPGRLHLRRLPGEVGGRDEVPHLGDGAAPGVHRQRLHDERRPPQGARGGRHWRELLDRIRDIRSSERVLYRQVLDLYATSVDYDPKAEASREFFAVVQNKLHFAAHGHTAAEAIASRADANAPFMGLRTFRVEQPRRSDIEVAKNYQEADELARLNTLVSAYFDAAEFRATRHEPTYMRDWLSHLDRLITAMDADVLPGPGTTSRREAIGHAKAEYEKYTEARRDEPSAVERSYLGALKATQKRLEGKTP